MKLSTHVRVTGVPAKTTAEMFKNVELDDILYIELGVVNVDEQ